MNRRFDAVILTYHSISEGPAPLCVKPRMFAAQMSWLKANSNVLPLSALVQFLVQGRPIPPRTIALTFDDGFSNFYTEAAPILKHLELPAIVFLPTAFCGKPASWNIRTGGRLLMTWDQIRELAGQGFNFGSHGINHLVLTDLSDTQIAYEVIESKRLIETEIKQDVHFFCYPYGRYDERTCRAVLAQYNGGACSTHLGALGHTHDRFMLPRVDVHYLRNFWMFRMLFTKRLQVYLSARRMMRIIPDHVGRS